MPRNDLQTNAFDRVANGLLSGLRSVFESEAEARGKLIADGHVERIRHALEELLPETSTTWRELNRALIDRYAQSSPHEIEPHE